jgi:phosphoribosylglycinamide formyltransferase-1
MHIMTQESASKPTLLIFASGSKTSGGSGFEKLVEATHNGILDAEIVGVVSQYAQGGVFERAQRLGIPFIHFDVAAAKSDPAGYYREIVRRSGAQWVALSGWVRMVAGLDPRTTFNIHPALLSYNHGEFGGQGMYGHFVHEAVAQALALGKVGESGFTMHFVTDEYDRGPIIAEIRVSLTPGMSAEEIGKLVNTQEHLHQARITNDIIHGRISWDGADPSSLRIYK